MGRKLLAVLTGFVVILGTGAWVCALGPAPKEMPPVSMEGGMMVPETGEEEMMPHRMMGPAGSGMMGPMMGRRSRACFLMAAEMAGGYLDLDGLRESLELSASQAAAIKGVFGHLRKETIVNAAALRLAELELVDILDEGKTNLTAVETKLKEIESLRTRIRFSHIRAAEEVKGALTPEQLERYQGLWGGWWNCAQGAAGSPCPQSRTTGNEPMQREQR